jgi:lipoyl(octanoyl) transferase
MRSVPSAVADGCSDCRLVSSDRANWQSAIENWQCRHPSAIADGTDPIATATPFIQASSLPKTLIGWQRAATVRIRRTIPNWIAVNEQRKLLVKRLGRVEYGEALAIQKTTELAVKEGREIDTLLLLEHPHTLTVGRRGDSAGILMSSDLLAARGVSVFETNRGGKITYHGLGQVVGYPIINLSPDREDVHAFVRDLEEVLMRTLAGYQINAFRIEGLTGVHTSRGKVAAIGVHIARWITTHGFALNVSTDLSFFNLIIACDGEQVTSMQDLLGHEVDMREVEERIAGHFAEVFDFSISKDLVHAFSVE